LSGAVSTGAEIAVLAFAPEDPTGYGRLIVDAQGQVRAIREEEDASDAERRLSLYNAGAMALRVPDLLGLLARISNANRKREYYLTDAVAIAAAEGAVVRTVPCAIEEALGVNTLAQLAEAEAIFQRRARRRAMEQGARMVAPDTVWLSFDTQIGRDVSFEPHVFLGPGVIIEDGAKILAYCHLVGARVRAGARIGPF